jgi:hypothetical protein
MEREGEQPAPEAWIGRAVMIGIGTSGARLSGVLREVSDRCVVLNYGAESGRAGPDTSSTPGAMCKRSSSPTKSSLVSRRMHPDPHEVAF